MNAYKNASYVGFVLMLFGLIITIYGFSFLTKLQDLDKNGVKVKGTVTKIEEKAIYRSPWVTFKTLEGKEYTFLSDLEVNKDLFKYQIGQEVEVIYHKNDPTNARINDFWERNFGQLFLGFLGVFLLFFGMIFRRRMLKKAAKYAQR